MTSELAAIIESALMKNSTANPLVVYDGNCPFCAWYVDQLSQVNDFDKVDARHNQQVVDQLDRIDIDIDRDIAMIDQGQIYSGADALHRLARQSDSNGSSMNKLLRGLFVWHPLAVVIYPVLRLLRRLYLRFSGQPDINGNNRRC